MFDQLKLLMEHGERYIIVEHGEPRYVFMRFHDYTALAGGRGADAVITPGGPDLARVNAEFEDARPRLQEPASPDPFRVPVSSPAPDPAAIRLEDLAL